MQARSWGFPEGVRFFFRKEFISELRTFFRKENFEDFFLERRIFSNGGLFLEKRISGGRGGSFASKGVRLLLSSFKVGSSGPPKPPSYAPGITSLVWTPPRRKFLTPPIRIFKTLICLLFNILPAHTKYYTCLTMYIFSWWLRKWFIIFSWENIIRTSIIHFSFHY